MPAGSSRKPNPYDVHVGSRLRACRTLSGFTQERLGASVGLSFQQIQKYEKGQNRIGASRLQEFSKLLNVPPSYFFEDMPFSGDAPAAIAREVEDAEWVPPAPDNIYRRQSLELVRYFCSIDDARLRNSIFQLIKSIARTSESVSDDELTEPESMSVTP